MNARLIASAFIVGALLAPQFALAADADSERRSATTFVKDSVITTKVKAALAKEKMSTLVKIRVDTDDKGVVHLSGSAPTREDAERAATIAKGIEGVVSVKNEIRIKKDD